MTRKIFEEWNAATQYKSGDRVLMNGEILTMLAPEGKFPSVGVPPEKPIRIGGINHEYGGLIVRRSEESYFWSIEANTFEEWEEIPESLYLELIKLVTNK